MIGLSQNQGPETPEIAAYQHKTVRLRFLGQLCGALTGATFLAVLGVVGDALIKVQAASAAIGGASGILSIINPGWAIGLMAVGLVCAFLSTTFYQKAQILDSDFNAKKIAAATRKAKDAPETQIAVEVGRDQDKNRNRPLAPVINTQEINALRDTQEAIDRSEEQEQAAQQAGKPRTRITQGVALDKVQSGEQALTIS